MSDDYTAVLLEDINHKFDAIMEGQVLLVDVSRKVNSMDKRLIRVEADVKVIKAVLTDHSHTLGNHEQRITKLEKAV